MSVLTENSRAQRQRIVEGEKPDYSIARALRLQATVIGAIMLRDMRTRYGRTHLSYIIAILWPLSHLVGLVLIQVLTRRVAPLGTDLTVYIATGFLPYILCFYPARLMMIAVEMNRPLFLFPIVKTTDVIIARMILEILTAIMVSVIFGIGLAFFDIDIVPLNIPEAIQAILGSVYLGVGFGLLNITLWAFFRMAGLIGFIGIILVLYGTSGIFFSPMDLPEHIRDILWYNPLLHCVEWLRTAYYDGYGDAMLSRSYLIAFSSLLVALGLAGDRLFRGKFLMTP